MEATRARRAEKNLVRRFHDPAKAETTFCHSLGLQRLRVLDTKPWRESALTEESDERPARQRMTHWFFAIHFAANPALGKGDVVRYFPIMSIQQLLITEVSQQPEDLLREVWHYLNFLKAKAKDQAAPAGTVRPGFGSVPGIELADDFDAPLADFADYRP